MINLSRIQLELERAKEGLREVEETIQKVEGKSFPNGPGRYNNLKVQLHSDKNRNPLGNEDGKLQRRTIALNSDARNRRISSDDLSFNLKRGPRDKRDIGLKRQGFDSRPQSITARLSTISHQPADDEDDEEFTKKLTLPSRVITTAAEAPSRQEIIAAQTGDELVKQRNRRMFGALVGTLQKFCKEETRVREREEKRLKVEKKLEEDAKREKEKLLQEKRELFLERKRREIEIKRIEWSLNRVKEYEAWEANVMPLKNFIQTHAKPHIFYLPSSHNNKTEERLAQSQKLVERMIEKRKNNLKEEIENSEKKARRTVAEEEEEEEAENIPQNSESVQNVEQKMEIDFDAVNKENGFHEDVADSKTQGEDVENTKSEEPGKEEGAWSDKDTEVEEKENRDSEVENKVEEKQTDEPDVSNDMCGSNEVREGNNNEGDSDGGGEENKDNGTYDGTGEGRTFDEPEETEKNESNMESVAKESDTDEIHKVPVNESETVVPTGDEQTETSEAQPVPEGDAKKVDSEEKKDETEKEHKEDSPSRKPKRSYRSPGRRSRSPRRFAKTRRRSRSTSRKRKSYRRRSKSHSKSVSPSKKSRKDRSPRSRRRSEDALSRRKSSRTRRRSSSKSSGSASPKKRMKFRSSSTSNSRSDSD